MPVGKYSRSKRELERLKKMNEKKKGKTYEEIYGEEKAKEIKFKKSNLNHPKWKGGIKNINGYIYVLKKEHPFSNNNGYIFEHRLVMEKKLGRYLKPEEIIHHINGVRKDNRIKNLELTNKRDHNLKHGDTIHRLTKKEIMKSAELRKRKPNEKGEFFCHLCKNWKPKSEFTKQKRNKLGVGSYCKKCINNKKCKT